MEFKGKGFTVICPECGARGDLDWDNEESFEIFIGNGGGVEIRCQACGFTQEL